jgi:hypothetical protein
MAVTCHGMSLLVLLPLPSLPDGLALRPTGGVGPLADAFDEVAGTLRPHSETLVTIGGAARHLAIQLGAGGVLVS